MHHEVAFDKDGTDFTTIATMIPITIRKMIIMKILSVAIRLQKKPKIIIIIT